ncbi:MAG: redox-sensing transcriptional repressor Rex [Actinomycetia bacterium]|nr:redox-sensing transcriptional repressor Rex [Actinomycetes bacterium]
MVKKDNKKNETKKDLADGIVERLSTYLNCLVQLKDEGYKIVSSKELGKCSNVNPAEIRRDFIQFGSFGKKGVGYYIDGLINEIQHILGAKEVFKIALVGSGNLGTAITGYEGLRKHGFHITAVFDNSPSRIGKAIHQLVVEDTKKIKSIVKKNEIEIGIIAVPEEAAQTVAEELVKAGVRVIINYTSVLIHVPDYIKVHNSNPAIELLHTLYFLSKRPSVKDTLKKKI